MQTANNYGKNNRAKQFKIYFNEIEQKSLITKKREVDQ